MSSDYTGSLRPVPFSAKFQRVHPGTTGVTVLEHMERLDAVEASLERLGIENVVEEIEEDVGESSSSSAPRPIAVATNVGLVLAESALIASSSAPSRGGAPELTPVPEADSPAPSVLTEEHEEDVVAMSKSLSHIDTRPLSASAQHGRGMSSHSAQATRRMLDWMQDEPAKKRTVISEVRRLVTDLCTPLSAFFFFFTHASGSRWLPRNRFFGVGEKSGLGIIFELGLQYPPIRSFFVC